MSSLKKPSCAVGWNCGNSCISRKKQCWKNEPQEISTALESFSELLVQSASVTKETLLAEIESTKSRVFERIATSDPDAESDEVKNLIFKKKTYDQLVEAISLEGATETLDFNSIKTEADALIQAFSGATPEFEKAEKRLMRAMSGDIVDDVPPVGNEKIRGKVNSPPLPSAVANSSGDADSSFRNFLEESEILIQVSPTAMLGILEDGRFKNALERKSNEGNFKQARLDAEKEILGVLTEASASERPIYGYVESKNYANSTPKNLTVGHYGGLQIRLKEEVKARTSVTIGDSLNNYMRKKPSHGTPMLNPSLAIEDGVVELDMSAGGDSKDLKIKKADGKVEKIPEYIEAQIFGGISLDDIGLVAIPVYIYEEFPELITQLQTKGIAIKPLF